MKSERIRYIKPVPVSKVAYSNAKKFALDLDLNKNECFMCIANGSFVFGDFVEAFIHEWNFKLKTLTISTLSMSFHNVENLINIVKFGHVEKINLIISDYFYAHEIGKGKILNYLLNSEYANKFIIGIARVHVKVVQFETEKGNKIVMHGSVNLRSSRNIEQFDVEVSEKRYDFYQNFFDEILQKTKINGKLTQKQTDEILNDVNF